MMNCLRAARLVTAAMMIAVTLTGTGRADDAKTKPATKPDTASAAPEQVWEGKLSVGGGLSLRLVVHVGKTADGKLTAKMDSPDQGAKGLKLDTISLDKTTLSFEMKAILGKFEGKLNADGTEAVGTWTQAGNSLPLTLKKTDKATEIRRPQTPKGPFPYKMVEVTYSNKPGKVTLAGTLTEPEGAGPFPALILISGSGPQDRDETLFEHKPFLVLADALTRRGIAVLRVDDRGVGGSTGTLSTSTSDDFAGDVLAGIAFLKTRSEIDPRRIGLMGHSEGGIIAPMVAAREPDVAFIVLMAGTGLPGEEILYLQGQAILKAMGADEKALKLQLDLQKRLFEILKTEKDEKKAETAMRDLAKAAIESLPEDQRKALGKADTLISAQLKAIRTPWFRYFLAHDPRPILAQVHCPVLALIGEKDRQVPPRENLSQIESSLKAAGNNRITVKELPGLNHLFQKCTTGAPSEYAEIEQTIDPSALTVITDWISEQAESVVKNAKRNIPYAEPANERQMLDVYAPENARNLPVVFWIHGGGWQTGDKASAHAKPKAFVDKGYVFVSTNYRLLPGVDMETIVRDVAKSIHWVHDHIAEYGGDPQRLVVTGHSAGAQLAALICTDDRYLKAEGLTLAIIKGCVPVDGDTYDVPLMIETGNARRKALGQPNPKFGHYEKFGSDPVKHRNFSAVNHVARGNGTPPFLLLYVAEHPDTSAQARRLGSALNEAGIPAKLFGAKNTEHSRINENLGLPDDPATKAVFEFVAEMTKK